MKILQISTFFHPVIGGVETHVFNLSRKLIAQGHEVEVLCSDSNKNAPRISEKQSTVSGIKVKRFFTLVSLSFYHKFYPGLFFYLLKSDFDIVHVHGFRKIETYLALFAARLKKKKIVLTSHNPFPVTTRSNFMNLLINIHDRTFGRWFTKKMDKIITILPSEQKVFMEKFKVPKDKLATVHNGVEEIFFQQGSSEQFFKDWRIAREKWQGLVVSAARISYAKGFQNLELVVRELPKVLFFIAGGDDGYLSKLKLVFTQCPNIFFSEHYLSLEKLRDMLSAADLFVLPSLHEAFGIALIEALAQGCPVITTNKGGPDELLNEDLAIKLDPTNQKAWKESIQNLLQDPKRRQVMGKLGKNFAARFNWDKITSKIINLYIEITK